MRVIHAGFPKCGTKTMAAVFEEFGLNNYDFPEQFTFQCDEWLKIFKEGATIDEFREMFKLVDTITDLPACYFWEELHQAFPEAKIILTQRDSEEEWYESFKNQFVQTNTTYLQYIAPWLSPTLWRMSVFFRAIFFGTFGFAPCPPDKMNELLCKMAYRRHITSVIEKAPKHKLLIYNMKDGWEPLCRFLNKPLPNKPFPHQNKKGEIVRNFFERHPVFIRIREEVIISSSFIAIVSAYVTYKLVKGDMKLPSWSFPNLYNKIF